MSDHSYRLAQPQHEHSAVLLSRRTVSIAMPPQFIRCASASICLSAGVRRCATSLVSPTGTVANLAAYTSTRVRTRIASPGHLLRRASSRLRRASRNGRRRTECASRWTCASMQGRRRSHADIIAAAAGRSKGRTDCPFRAGRARPLAAQNQAAASSQPEHRTGVRAYKRAHDLFRRRAGP
jgi:hypothetical protein